VKRKTQLGITLFLSGKITGGKTKFKTGNLKFLKIFHFLVLLVFVTAISRHVEETGHALIYNCALQLSESLQ